MKCSGFLVAGVVLSGCRQASRGPFDIAAAELPAARDAAKAAGLPLHVRELAPNPPVKSEENAHPLLDEAIKSFKQFKATNPSEQRQIFRSETDELGALTKIVRRLEPTIGLTKRATNRTQIDFGRNWDTDQPWDMKFPEYAEIRNLAQVLCHVAQIKTRAGDSAVIPLFESCFRLGDFVGSDPTLIAALVQIAIDAITCKRIELILPTRKDDPQFSAEIASLISRRGETVDLWHIFKGESATDYMMFSNPANYTTAELQQYGEEGAELAKLIVPGVSQELLAKGYSARTLQFWTRAKQSLNAQDSPEQQCRVLLDLIDGCSRSDLANGTLNFMRDVRQNTAKAVLTRTARFRTLRALVRILQFRQKTNRLPKSLSEAGVTQLDPFNGKPLNLAVSDQLVKVYSVGKDGKDDGGIDKVKDHKDVAAACALR